MSKDTMRALDDSELEGVSGGWNDGDLDQLAEAQAKIPYATCPHCRQTDTGWQCYADYYSGSPGLVCVCSNGNCQKYFIVLADGSAHAV